MDATGAYPRLIGQRLQQAVENSPAVLIHGPRQCGKTTLAQALSVAQHPILRPSLPSPRWNTDRSYLTFDDPTILAVARDDPSGFVAGLPGRVAIDEVQRAPEVFLPIKLAIDRMREPGRFVLTGSTNVLLVPQLSDSLVGRMSLIRLHPLSQTEIAARSETLATIEPVGLASTPQFGDAPPPSGQPTSVGAPTFLDTLFGAKFTIQHSERLGSELIDRIVAGGFPAALALSSSTLRSIWYEDHVETLVQRDVRDLSRITQMDAVPQLLQAIAAHTSTLLNTSSLAARFQLNAGTIRSYMTLLERLFLFDRLPAWHHNQLKRQVKRPKLHFGDTGMACALLGLDAEMLAGDRSLLGCLAETFVYGELVRQASWHTRRMLFYHYRDRDGAEVDIVIESGLRVAGVEVKAGGTVRSTDFRGLRKLLAAAGDRFVCGVVLYDGEKSLPFGDRMFAVPIRRLWDI